MSGHLCRLVVIVLALGTAGAQLLCCCPQLAAAQPKPQPSPAAKKIDCCKQAQAKPAPIKHDDRCDKCSLKHRPQQAMPQEKAGVYGAHLAMADFGTPSPLHLFTIETLSAAIVESAPAPPLLLDLFHVHSLLLN